MVLTGYTENNGIVTLLFLRKDGKQITLEFPGKVRPTEQLIAQTPEEAAQKDE